jgi:mannosyltransferase OCH1-like enzyme
MIPKIIHQLWIGPKQPPLILMDTWKRLNPEWDYIFWDEKALEHHFKNGLQNQKQYDEMEELCGKCDIARVEILNAFGGFFIDADSVCLHPLDDYLVVNDSFSCYENEFERGNLVACGYLASTKDNDLIKLLIEGIGRVNVKQLLDVPNRSPWDNDHRAWQMTGSGLLTSTIFKNKYTPISIYPSYFFIPEHYSGVKYKGLGKSYSNQLWGSTVGSSFYGYNLNKINPPKETKT